MCFGNMYVLGRLTAQQAGLVHMFDRILSELSLKLKRLDVDQSELACIKGIIVLNSGEIHNLNWKFLFANLCWHFVLDSRCLVGRKDVESLRSKIYACLDDYCRQRKPCEDGRFAQMLLRLPALRSMSLKCMELLHSYGVLQESQLDDIIREQLTQGI